MDTHEQRLSLIDEYLRLATSGKSDPAANAEMMSILEKVEKIGDPQLIESLEDIDILAMQIRLKSCNKDSWEDTVHQYGNDLALLRERVFGSEPKFAHESHGRFGKLESLTFPTDSTDLAWENYMKVNGLLKCPNRNQLFSPIESDKSTQIEDVICKNCGYPWSNHKNITSSPPIHA